MLSLKDVKTALHQLSGGVRKRMVTVGLDGGKYGYETSPAIPLERLVYKNDTDLVYARIIYERRFPRIVNIRSIIPEKRTRHYLSIGDFKEGYEKALDRIPEGVKITNLQFIIGIKIYSHPGLMRRPAQVGQNIMYLAPQEDCYQWVNATGYSYEIEKISRGVGVPYDIELGRMRIGRSNSEHINSNKVSKNIRKF